MGVEEFCGFWIGTRAPRSPRKRPAWTPTAGPSLLVNAALPDPQSQANLAELRAHLIDAIHGLGKKERLVTNFYFYEELTLKEFGKAINLTEGRISQLLKRALGKLRERLKSAPLVSGVGGW